ncbi:MAG: lipoyl domain-containing protein [Candidatus Omnitrophica bacterium]|nr:lipoyl domain-containing protein [Candidatus Omnitrophota bacterium]
MKEVILPALGEGIEKATVSYWFFKEGDAVAEKSDLVELATDKATFNLPSPCAGVLSQILAAEGLEVRVGEKLCLLEES